MPYIPPVPSGDYIIFFLGENGEIQDADTLTEASYTRAIERGNETLHAGKAAKYRIYRLMMDSDETTLERWLA